MRGKGRCRDVGGMRRRIDQICSAWGVEHGWLEKSDLVFLDSKLSINDIVNSKEKMGKEKGIPQYSKWDLIPMQASLS